MKSTMIKKKKIEIFTFCNIDFFFFPLNFLIRLNDRKLIINILGRKRL